MEGVIYLQYNDIKNSKIPSYISQGKPVFLMIQADFCHFCEKAKPDFQKCVYENPNICFATITGDGDETESKCMDIVKKWDKNFRGYPSYLLFDSKGMLVETYKGNRDKDSITSYLKQKY